MQTEQKTKITPPEIARKWGIAVQKIHAWIRSGELPAIDASTGRKGRPRFLIDVDDLAEFERRRMVRQPAKPARKARQADSDFEMY
jgi:hypothetical protein